jgi:hypothetical protein
MSEAWRLRSLVCCGSVASRTRSSTGLMRSGDQQVRSGSRVAIGNRSNSAGFKDDAKADELRAPASRQVAVQFPQNSQPRHAIAVPSRRTSAVPLK